MFHSFGLQRLGPGTVVWAAVDSVIKLLLIVLCVVSLPNGGYAWHAFWYSLMILMNIFLAIAVRQKVGEIQSLSD